MKIFWNKMMGAHHKPRKWFYITIFGLAAVCVLLLIGEAMKVQWLSVPFSTLIFCIAVGPYVWVYGPFVSRLFKDKFRQDTKPDIVCQYSVLRDR